MHEDIRLKAELYCNLNKLKALDHKGQKYIDGEYTAEEYEPIKQQRKALRERVREIEAILKEKE